MLDRLFHRAIRFKIDKLGLIMLMATWLSIYSDQCCSGGGMRWNAVPPNIVGVSRNGGALSFRQMPCPNFTMAQIENESRNYDFVFYK